MIGDSRQKECQKGVLPQRPGMGPEVSTKNAPRQAACNALDARRERLDEAAACYYVLFG